MYFVNLTVANWVGNKWLIGVYYWIAVIKSSSRCFFFKKKLCIADVKTLLVSTYLLTEKPPH